MWGDEVSRAGDVGDCKEVIIETFAADNDPGPKGRRPRTWGSFEDLK